MSEDLQANFEARVPAKYRPEPTEQAIRAGFDRAQVECPACGEYHGEACEFGGFRNGIDAAEDRIIAWLETHANDGIYAPDEQAAFRGVATAIREGQHHGY